MMKRGSVMQRKSYRISKSGSLNNMKLIPEEIKKPADNQVTIKVCAIGLNLADVFTIMGLYKAAPKNDFIPGLEFSGVIVDKGSDVEDFNLNDKVMGVIKFGAYTTHITLDYRYVIKIPDGWSFEESASFLVQALTAYYALVPLGNLKKNQTVLIHSAAGGVGIYANRIAKKYSAFTIGTVGDPSKVELLKKEGCDEIIIRGRNFKEELKQKLNGRYIDIIMEAVGGRVQKESFEMLAPTGRMVAYGLSQFAPHGPYPNYLKLLIQFLSRPRYDTLDLIESNRSVLGFNLIWLYERVELFKEMISKLEDLHLDKPFIGHVFPFDKLPDAVKKFQSGKTTGKVVVTVD